MPLFFDNLRGGPVEAYRWILPIRALQATLAVIVLGLASYVLSVDDGGLLRPGVIPLLIISILTLVPILPLTTPLVPLQRRLYDPRIALIADLFATLFWLAAFVTLAAYLHVFRSSYALDGLSVMRVWSDVVYETVGYNWRTWQCGVAAAIFGAFEFLLFTLSTLVFLYCYHLSLSCGSLYAANPRDSFLGPTTGITETRTVTSPIAQPPTSLALASGADPELGYAKPVLPEPETDGPAMGLLPGEPLSVVPTPTRSIPTPMADEDVKVHHPGKGVDEQVLDELLPPNLNLTAARHESTVLGEKFDAGLGSRSVDDGVD